MTNLRTRTIRLAQANPEIRAAILPLLGQPRKAMDYLDVEQEMWEKAIVYAKKLAKELQRELGLPKTPKVEYDQSDTDVGVNLPNGIVVSVGSDGELMVFDNAKNTALLKTVRWGDTRGLIKLLERFGFNESRGM